MRSGPDFFGDYTQSGPESQDRTGLRNHTSVRSQNLGPDCLQIGPVRSGPSPSVRSGQSSCELAELLAYEVLSGIMGYIVRGSYIGVDPAITECLPGMLCAKVT